MNNSVELSKIRLAVVDNQFAGTPKEYRAFKFLIAEIDRQHDEFYNHVRFVEQDKEMSSYRHAQYAFELREEIISLGEKVRVLEEKLFKADEDHDKFVSDAFDAVKKLESEISRLKEEKRNGENIPHL